MLAREVTVARVARHFRGMVRGVERFELPNLHALNFLLHGALDGGGTLSLKTDAQGKVFSTALLRMKIPVPAALARRIRGSGTVSHVTRAASGGVLTITLDRAEKRNALSRAMIAELADALAQAELEPSGAGRGRCAARARTSAPAPTSTNCSSRPTARWRTTSATRWCWAKSS